MKNPTKAKIDINLMHPRICLIINPESQSEALSGLYLDVLKPFINNFGLEVVSINPAEPIGEPASQVPEANNSPQTALHSETLVYTEEQLSGMLKAQLSEILTARNLNPWGYKADLVARILESQ